MIHQGQKKCQTAPFVKKKRSARKATINKGKNNVDHKLDTSRSDKKFKDWKCQTEPFVLKIQKKDQKKKVKTVLK